MTFDYNNKLFLGIVEENVDPKRKGRIKVRVQSVFDEISTDDIPWANPYKGSNGESFSTPAIGKIVNVCFENNDLYSPYYIYVEHYNLNLQAKLKMLSGGDYAKFKALLFNHQDQIFVEGDKLTIDHKYNQFTIDNDSMNLLLKDNTKTLNIGSTDADQDMILGTNFFEWFDEFLTIMLRPTSLIGNFGAPILKADLEAHITKYINLSKLKKFRSKNVKIVDNDKVKIVKRDFLDIPKEDDQIIQTLDPIIKAKIETNTSNNNDAIKEAKPTRLIKIDELDQDDNNVDYIYEIKDDKGNVIKGNSFIVDDEGDVLPISDDEVVNYIDGNDALADNEEVTSEADVVSDDNYGDYVPLDSEEKVTTNSIPKQKISTIVANPKTKGTVKTFKSGNLVGDKEYVSYQGFKVVKDFYDPLIVMVKAAEQDGVKLQLNDAFREFDEQLNVRDKNKTEQFTADELKNNSSKLYNPETAKPGWGFHTYGNAFDFATANGSNKAYKWLVKNAFTYGFIRTVKSETWHWEYKPWDIGRGSNSQFCLVSRDHSSWRGLV